MSLPPLPQRLRTWANIIDHIYFLAAQEMREAAAEIERLNREIALDKLVEASEDLGLYEHQKPRQRRFKPFGQL